MLGSFFCLVLLLSLHCRHIGSVCSITHDYRNDNFILDYKSRTCSHYSMTFSSYCIILGRITLCNEHLPTFLILECNDTVDSVHFSRMSMAINFLAYTEIYSRLESLHVEISGIKSESCSQFLTDLARNVRLVARSVENLCLEFLCRILDHADALNRIEHRNLCIHSLRSLFKFCDFPVSLSECY